MTGVTTARLRQLRAGALAVVDRPAIFEVTGPGALACLQGLLTNDLAKPGDSSLVYGALLTPKGAIVVDYWVARLGERFLLIAEREGHTASLDLFRRTLPPRLARLQDLSQSHTVIRLLGKGVDKRLAAAGLPQLPGPGHVTTIGDLALAEPQPAAPFHGLIIGPAALIESTRAELIAGGAGDGTAADIEAARVLAGWPRLGAEIGDKTLVQEVRYDEIGGVSYTKGCYTGQETVARLHFRGHPNRELRGLSWEQPPAEDESGVSGSDGKELGRVTSRLEVSGRWLGLALIRREVALGTTLTAAGAEAEVVALPFAEND